MMYGGGRDGDDLGSALGGVDGEDPYIAENTSASTKYTPGSEVICRD